MSEPPVLNGNGLGTPNPDSKCANSNTNLNDIDLDNITYLESNDDIPTAFQDFLPCEYEIDLIYDDEEEEEE